MKAEESLTNNILVVQDEFKIGSEEVLDMPIPRFLITLKYIDEKYKAQERAMKRKR